MGCAADRVSYEATRYGQGVLTYALLPTPPVICIAVKRSERPFLALRALSASIMMASKISTPARKATSCALFMRGRSVGRTIVSIAPIAPVRTVRFAANVDARIGESTEP